MAVVSYKRYSDEKDQFFRSHKNDFRIETSTMDEYGRYYKDYLFEDGAIWHEDMSPVFESATVEIKMVKVSVEVKMMRVEYYNTDDSTSRYYYEKW